MVAMNWNKNDTNRLIGIND